MSKHCNLYVVRHGETEWNRRGMVQGHSDISLTPEGEAQAHARAAEFKDVPFSHVASSDLSRAHRTAMILTKERKVDVQTSSQLREQYYGEWEGQKFDVIREKYGPDFNAFTGEDSHPVPGVESYHRVAQRAESFLCGLAIKHIGNHVLVVTHGGVMKGLVYRLGLSDLYQGHFDNLGYLHLESDGAALRYVNAYGFLVRNHGLK